ncbi:30S ribosomal protein S6 [Bacteroidetes bacterium SCGC AAA795-G10]|nr:30S ribosomal protein S6 [Bacteroidetes bacterium SCGC AAA795-G10]
MNQYETVFILNPVLSEKQIEEAVQKYTSFIKTQKGKLSYQENWGLKKLSYPIENKKSGFYHLFEFTAPKDTVSELEIEFRRDERIMRYLTVKLDKNAKAWADKRKKRKTAKTK